MSLHALLVEYVNSNQNNSDLTRDEITKERVRAGKYYLGGLLLKLLGYLSLSLAPLLAARTKAEEIVYKYGAQFSISVIGLAIGLMVFGGIKSWQLNRADLNFAKRLEDDILRLTEKYDVVNVYKL